MPAALEAQSAHLDLHATCVAFAGRGVLLSGGSGRGKSALALRLLECGAWLVADDVVRLTRHRDRLVATTPRPVEGRGLLEARALGIFRLPGVCGARLVAHFDLDGGRDLERLPQQRSDELLGIRLQFAHLDSSRPDAAALVRVAVLAGREA